jgi:hypothetical protein
MPQSFGAGGTISLTISNRVGTSTPQLTFDAPVVSAVSSINSAGSSGISISVTGMNFGTMPAVETVFLPPQTRESTSDPRYSCGPTSSIRKDA